MKFVDLSHPISNKIQTYPSDPDISIILEKDIENNNSQLHSFSMGTHTATHLDAPSHIISGGKTITDFSLSQFTGNTIKVDQGSYQKLFDIDFKLNGIIYDTGWYKNFYNSEVYYGPNRPIIPKELISYIEYRNFNFFGCDLPSVDATNSKNKPIHNALLKQDKIIYESLTNLDQLPLLKQFEFYGFPLNLDGLDGSPVRALAII